MDPTAAAVAATDRGAVELTAGGGSNADDAAPHSQKVSDAPERDNLEIPQYRTLDAPAATAAWAGGNLGDDEGKGSDDEGESDCCKRVGESMGSSRSTNSKNNGSGDGDCDSSATMSRCNRLEDDSDPDELHRKRRSSVDALSPMSFTMPALVAMPRSFSAIGSFTSETPTDASRSVSFSRSFSVLGFDETDADSFASPGPGWDGSSFGSPPPPPYREILRSSSGRDRMRRASSSSLVEESVRLPLRRLSRGSPHRQITPPPSYAQSIKGLAASVNGSASNQSVGGDDQRNVGDASGGSNGNGNAVVGEVGGCVVNAEEATDLGAGGDSVVVVGAADGLAEGNLEGDTCESPPAYLAPTVKISSVSHSTLVEEAE